MHRMLTAIATTGALIVGAQALAVDSIDHSTMSKRRMTVQIVGCMRKQMSASKSISYNEAAKVCRDLISNPSNNSSSGALVASDTLAKP
jgi:hypothetical protein